MQCVHPIVVKSGRKYGFGDKSHGFVPSHVVVPCGKCIACRINKTREWKSRLIMELCFWEDASFVTLTYDSEHLPVDAGLHKDDLQKFFKRLRFDLSEKKRDCKYFACGEYGDKFGRPHYHAIIFGINPIRDDLLVKGCWLFGNVDIGSVTPESIGYVTGYVQKKLTGDASANYLGNIPPFQVNSNGLGDRFVMKFKDKLRDDLSFKFMGKSYPLCKRHKEMLFNELERVEHLNDAIDRQMQDDDLYSTLRNAERHLIQQYNMFKEPSERRLWR